MCGKYRPGEVLIEELSASEIVFRHDIVADKNENGIQYIIASMNRQPKRKSGEEDTSYVLFKEQIFGQIDCLKDCKASESKANEVNVLLTKYIMERQP